MPLTSSNIKKAKNYGLTLTIGYALFNFIDRFNENISEDKSSVAIGIKAIK